MRSTAKSLATAPEPFKPSQHFVGCQLAVLGYRIRAKGHRLPNTHILQSAAELETFLGQAGTGRPLVIPRALLNQVSSLDHLAHIVGGIGAKIIAAVGQLSDGHILFLDMIQDNRLRGIESANTFGIEYLPQHFKELAMQTPVIRIALRYSSISNPVSRLGNASQSTFLPRSIRMMPEKSSAS